MVVIVEDDAGRVKHEEQRQCLVRTTLGEGATPSREAAAFQAPLGTSSFIVLGKIITLTGAVTVHPGTPVAAVLLQPDKYASPYPVELTHLREFKGHLYFFLFPF